MKQPKLSLHSGGDTADYGLTEEDQPIFMRFQDRLRDGNVRVIEFLTSEGIEITTTGHHANLVIAIWIEFFKNLESRGAPEFKYSSMVNFLEAYPSFRHYEEKVRSTLMRNANWVVMYVAD
jgi:hypothetical protein